MEQQQQQHTQYMPPPVVAQPGGPMQIQWMPLPPPIAGCPPGLEYLAQLDTLNIEQQLELMEILTGFDCKNKFRIMNSQNQQCYYAKEESEFCHRICCGPQRGFVFHLTDNNNQEVMRVVRDFYCCKGCYCCPGESCYYYACIQDRSGQVLGWVSNRFFCCKPRFGIYDAEKNLIATIKGPCCPIQCICKRGDVDFAVIESQTDGSIGTISKVWPGFLQDACTKADNFRVTFPQSLDVKQKAVILGAVFIIDMMIYEQQENNNN